MENPFKSLKKEDEVKENTEVKEEKKEEKKEVKRLSDDETKRNRILYQKQEILKKYGGLESNVPINSSYWKLRV